MRTRLLGSLLAFGLVTPLTLMTASTARAQAIPCSYAIIGGGNTFPMQAPGKAKIIEITCKKNARSKTEVIIRGRVWVVGKGQTRRFKTNKRLGILPKITRFTLRCPGEGVRTRGKFFFKF